MATIIFALLDFFSLIFAISNKPQNEQTLQYLWWKKNTQIRILRIFEQNCALQCATLLLASE